MNAVQTWHIMNDYANKPATLWPGGENADDEKAVKPISYALTVCPRMQKRTGNQIRQKSGW